MNPSRLQQEDNVRRILQQYGDLLYRMSLSIVGNSADAEDMVQDTLVTWLSETPDFPDEAHEKQWLVKVVRNNSLMLIRKRKNRDRILSEQAKVSVGRMRITAFWMFYIRFPTNTKQFCCCFMSRSTVLKRLRQF